MHFHAYITFFLVNFLFNLIRYRFTFHLYFVHFLCNLIHFQKILLIQITFWVQFLLCTFCLILIFIWCAFFLFWQLSLSCLEFVGTFCALPVYFLNPFWNIGSSDVQFFFNSCALLVKSFFMHFSPNFYASFFVAFMHYFALLYAFYHFIY